jgi:cysteine desulfurase
MAGENMTEKMDKVASLRDYLIDRVMTEIQHVRLNGSKEKRLPGNASFCFSFIEGESLLILLDQKGICGSGGSACTTGAVDPSHVLMAIGVPQEVAKGVVRLTLSEYTTKEEIDLAVEALKENLERLRSMSVEYEQYMKRMKK